VSVSVQVGRDDVILSVGKNTWILKLALKTSLNAEQKLTLVWTLGSLLDSGLDLIVTGTLLNAAGKIDDGNVGGWDTHRHAGKFAVERWDNLADGLGGTGAAGDNVLSSGTSTTPVL